MALSKIDTRGRGEVTNHGGRKVPVSAGRPCSHAMGGSRLETIARGKYHQTSFIKESRRGHQVAGQKT